MSGLPGPGEVISSDKAGQTERVPDEGALEELRWRGLIHRSDSGQESVTPGLAELLRKEPVTAYIGFDPSADSLHAGNLVAIMLLVHLQRHGHTPIALVGGGTGLIGDPGGKSEERPIMSREEVEANADGIRGQLERFLDFNAKENPARVVNNADWLDGMNTLDFLRDVGKHFTVNYMLAKESVRSRIAHEDGISYTEFSYLLLQACDYLTLYDRYGCRLQMGGSDQWGNITSGIELLRRVRGAEVHGVGAPLLVTAAGTKFGKTEEGAVWLDAERTSPYRFHQYWLNTADADVVSFLKTFTLLPIEEIGELERQTREKPEDRTAQRRLADEVTRTVHGDTALAGAQRASQVLFGGEVSGLRADELTEILEDAPSVRLPGDLFDGEGVPVVDLLVDSNLAVSKGEARRFVQGGGIYVNNVRVPDVRQRVHREQTVEGRALVLRRGSREYRLVLIED